MYLVSSSFIITLSKAESPHYPISRETTLRNLLPLSSRELCFRDPLLKLDFCSGVPSDSQAIRYVRYRRRHTIQSTASQSTGSQLCRRSDNNNGLSYFFGCAAVMQTGSPPRPGPVPLRGPHAARVTCGWGAGGGDGPPPFLCAMHRKQTIICLDCAGPSSASFRPPGPY